MSVRTWLANWVKSARIGLRALGYYAVGRYTWEQCEADTAQARRLVGRE
jgi:hypothetical protein